MKNKIAKIIYDTYRGNDYIPTEFAKMDKTTREDAIRKKIFDMLGLQEFEQKTFRRAFRAHKAEVFNVIEELADQIMIDGTYQKNAFFNQFVEIKNLALGDKNEFYAEGANRLEVAKFSGNHFDLKRRRLDVGQVFSVDTDYYGIKVYEEFERIMSGRADFAKLIAYIIDAVNLKLADIVYATFNTALSNLPAEFQAVGTYNQDAILQVLQHVQASNQTKPVIVGTSIGLAKLQDKSNLPMSNNMADERNQNGFLQVWNGYACMEIAQGQKLGSFDFTMDNDKLYVLIGGDKLVKMVLEGDTIVKETADGQTNADRTTEYTLEFKAGVAVSYSNMIGYLEIA
jgi:hypothetical protein